MVEWIEIMRLVFYKDGTPDQNAEEASSNEQ